MYFLKAITALLLIYAYKLTLANNGRGHIAIAVLQVFNDIDCTLRYSLGR